VKKYQRDAIKKMSGYTPGAQPKRADVIKLNANENPYPPCAAVLEEMGHIDADSLRRYPPAMSEGVRSVIARAHGVGPEQVVAVNGSDELLRMAVTTFVEPGGTIGMLDPSYSLYPVLAEINGSPVVTASAGPDWSLPDDFAEQMNRARAQLVFVVDPHAPSGKLVPAAQIAALASQLNGVLVADEAYVDFVDPELGHSLIPLLSQFDNLLLNRTLSKGYSLAGLRFGYGLGSASLIEPLLTKTRDSYNVDAVAQRLAMAAIEHRAQVALVWQKVRDARAFLRQELMGLGLEVPESQGNFLLATVAGCRSSAVQVVEALQAQGVLIRYFDHPRLSDKVRITVGTAEQNQRLLEVLKHLL
jgi:histidinol-phosphate aminotransferase